MFDIVVDNQFGIIEGKKKLVFIKTGRGGTIEGYKNKYLDICKSLSKRYGYTFVVSANPKESTCDLHKEVLQIGKYVKSYDGIY